MKIIFKYIIFSVSFFVFLTSCSSKEELSPYAKMQMEAINFIAQPTFAGDYIFYKVTSAKANLEMYYLDTKIIYFTCNKQDYVDENLNKFVISKDSITIAKEENGTLVLDTKKYYDTEKVFFKMPVSNFKIDTTRVIVTKYNTVSYNTTLPQILNFTYLRSALGGGAVVIAPDQTHFMNHGSVVAKKDEPTLNDFVKQIIKSESNNEIIAQKLLDFVTHEIEYNTKEATNGYETIKRPNEVLFTRNSDCSGKTILYASLLQQTPIKWCLLYFEKHICVGVAGNFKDRDALKFKLNNINYYMAEITDSNAVIGFDSWRGEMNENNLQFYQTSDLGSDVYDYKTKNKLEFVRGKRDED